MTERLGTLEYDLIISEEQLKTNIAKIEAELLKFNKTAEKALTIDVKKNKFLTAQEKILRQINATETQGILNKNKTLQAQEKTILAVRKGASEAKRHADANVIAEHKLLQAKNATVASQIRLNNLQNKRLSGITRVNTAYKKQGLHLQNLNTLAANYISIFAVLNLSKQIAVITGEFELQRKALAAIIQSKEEADKLFNKVTDLALVSPFAIKDLLGYTKMLAAYRIESSELIGTLSKLGDVSAGLGVDMSRLILAFGQVKAASVLRGQEIRQFTEAGIPMIALLADKFTELEGRVVSTNEVFGKVSKRLVSFERVSEIFDNMTAKGGIFFEAQRVQAETLAGMMSIFTDAMHKAFASIGDDNEGLLKGMISGATGALDNWREILRVIRILIATVGVYKVSLLALNVQRKASIYLMATTTKHIKAMTFADKRLYVQQNLVGKSALLMNRGLKAVGSTLKANAWLIGITAIVALTTVIYEAAVEANRLKNELKELSKTEFIETERLVKGFKDLASAAVLATDGSKDQRDAIAELNRTYKEYLPAQSMNIENLKKLKGNYDLLTKSIINKSRARAQEKGEEIIETEFQQESAIATESILSQLDKVGIIKRDAVNIVKIFREEFLKNSEQDAGFLLRKTVEQYMGEEVKLATLAGKFHWKTYLTGVDQATDAAYKYGWIIKKTTLAQEDLNASIKARYDFADVKFVADAAKMEELTDFYAKEKAALDGSQLTSEEHAKTIIKLNKEEIQSRIDYFENEAKYGDQAYKDEKINKFKAALKSLVDTGGNFQKLVNNIIKDAGGDDIIIRKLQVKDDEDPTTFIKRIKSEYADYNRLIKETEGIEAGFRKERTEGWEAAVVTSGKELGILKKGLKSTIALGKALGFTLEKKGAQSKKEKEIVDGLKAQLKLYQAIVKENENLRKVIGKDETQDQLQKIFGKQAKALSVDIPVDFDLESTFKVMSTFANKARKLGGDTGAKWADGVQVSISKLEAEDMTAEVVKSLKVIDEEMKLFKAKHKLFSEIFKLTGDQELAVKIAFDKDRGKIDLEKTLKSMVEEQALVVGIKLDYDNLVNQIESLPPTLQKSIRGVEKLIETGINNTLIKRLKFIRIEIPEGTGLQFDFDKIISDLNNKLEDIKSKAIDVGKGATEKEKKEITAASKQRAAAANEDARQRIEKIGAAYIEERIAISGLQVAYSDMTNASLQDIEKIIDVINKANQDLFTGDSLKGFFETADVDFTQFAGLFEGVFESKDIDEFQLKVSSIKEELKLIKGGETIRGVTVTDEEIAKLNNLVTLLEAFGLASENAIGSTFGKKLKKQAQDWGKLSREIGELIDVVDDLGGAFGMSVGGAAMEALRGIQAASVGIITVIDKTAVLAAGAVKGVEKASVILAIVGAALQVIKGLQDAFGAMSLDDQADMAANSKRASERLTIEYEINQVHKERLELQEKSTILGSNYSKDMKDAIMTIKEEGENLQKTMDTLFTEGLLTGTGSARNLWGKKTKEFSATVEDILKGVDVPEMSLFDKINIGGDYLDVFGSARNKRAMKRAVKDLEEGFESALTAMGKTASDVANFSTQEWLDFYSILEAQGNITDEGTKAMVDLAKKQYEALVAAKEQIKEIIGTITGDLGASMGDALAEGFAKGIDAAKGFKDAVIGIMEDIAKEKIMRQFFGDIFSKLESDMEASFDIGGDENWLDDIDRFFNASELKIDEANEALQKIRDWGEEQGYDLFGKGGIGDLSSLAKGFESLSEDTGRKLEALANSNREINIHNSAKFDAMIISLNRNNFLASQVLTVMQTMNQNLMNYMATFDSILMQGAQGRGIRAYMK